MDQALGLELFHNFTLIHDDIMDAAPLRRGKETVHEKWDTNVAILSGDAMLIEGLRHFDGATLRKALSYWWQDASAADLGTGKHYLTKPLNIETTIAELDTKAIQPGDLAVTVGGVHALVYLGNDHWIQADPSQGRVVVEHGKRDANPWFDNPVTIHRWCLLDP